jgi:DNA polymerase IV
VTDGASILHADLDAFFASVEQRDDSSLRGRPVIVGSGVVLAASYEAKAHGVRTAMGGRATLRLCPTAVVVPPRMAAYTQASRDVMEVFRDTSPLVEPMSIDEAFLDVGGLRRIAGTPEQIAARLRTDVAGRVGLPITVGVARTKFLAKVASAVAKPDGLLVVPPDGERDFLHPLPVRRLWGVGPVTAQRLNDRGIVTVGDLARVEEATLRAVVGPAAARHIHALARLRDPRPVRPGRRRGSMGAQRALGRWQGTPGDLDEVLLGLVDRVTRRMRDGGRVGRTVVLRLRFGDFTRATRSRSLTHPTADTAEVLRAVRALTASAADLMAERGLTLVGIAVGRLDDDDTVQLALPFDRRSPAALDVALDAVRDRFGSGAIGRTALLGRHPGIEMPVLDEG